MSDGTREITQSESRQTGLHPNVIASGWVFIEASYCAFGNSRFVVFGDHINFSSRGCAHDDTSAKQPLFQGVKELPAKEIRERPCAAAPLFVGE